jgi:hypothetical protein
MGIYGFCSEFKMRTNKAKAINLVGKLAKKSTRGSPHPLGFRS